MSAIPPISCSSSGVSAQLAQVANLLRGQEAGTTASLAPAQNGGMAQMLESTLISSQVAGSMQSGGATEQLMRTLITAMVLLTLLDQTRQSQESQNSTATLLALSLAGQALESEMATSSSYYFSYEQSSVSYAFVTGSDYAAASGAANHGATQLDVSA